MQFPRGWHWLATGLPWARHKARYEVLTRMCSRLAMYCSVSQHPVSGIQGTEVIAEWGLATQASYTMATHRYAVGYCV